MVVLPAAPFIRQLLYVSILNRICQHLFASIYKFLFILLLFAAALADRLEPAKAELDEAETRWLELSEI